jgi:hypothetical protein
MVILKPPERILRTLRCAGRAEIAEQIAEGLLCIFKADRLSAVLPLAKSEQNQERLVRGTLSSTLPSNKVAKPGQQVVSTHRGLSMFASSQDGHLPHGALGEGQESQRGATFTRSS